MSLISLPTELLEQIASYLFLPSFASLRLTSRHAHTRTLPLFKYRFFSTQHVAWTVNSLQRLVDISAHPELGDALRHLVIDGTPYHALLLWKMARRSADAGHLTPVTDDEDGSKLIARLTLSYQISEQEAERSARWFNETRFDVVCLKKVFERVRVGRLESVEFAYESMEIRYSKFARRYCERSQHEMSRPFVSTIGALASTGTSVRRIEIAEGKGYGAVSVGRLESLAPSLRAFDGLFEGLQVLKLKLRDWRMPDEGFELESGRAPFSVRFLAECRTVRVLDLSFFSTLEDDAFSELVRACRFKRLESVTLELFRVRLVSDLFQFFEPSEGCLKEVSLKHVMIDEHNINESGQDMWKRIFRGFADEKRKFEKLQVFHAERLFFESPLGARRVFLKREGLKTAGLRVEGENWRATLREYANMCLCSEGGAGWESGATTYPFAR